VAFSGEHDFDAGPVRKDSLNSFPPTGAEKAVDNSPNTAQIELE
jgi:hypothetical protein